MAGGAALWQHRGSVRSMASTLHYAGSAIPSCVPFDCRMIPGHEATIYLAADDEWNRINSLWRS